MFPPALSIRLAGVRDADGLRPAHGHDPLRGSGRALIAEQDGTAIAAVTLTSGAVVADPSVPAAGEAVRLLRRRRYQLLRQGGAVARLSSIGARPASAAA